MMEGGDQATMLTKRAARRLRCMEAHLSGAAESMIERGLDERSLARADEALLSLAYVVADKPSTAEEAAASSSGKLLGQEMGALESLGERLRVYQTGAKMVTSVIKMGLDLHSGAASPSLFYFNFNFTNLEKNSLIILIFNNMAQNYVIQMNLYNNLMNNFIYLFLQNSTEEEPVHAGGHVGGRVEAIRAERGAALRGPVLHLRRTQPRRQQVCLPARVA